jgi:hypothetical protein
MDYFQKVMGVPVIVDPLAMVEAGITNESPINLSTNKIATRTILKKLLAELALTYVIKDEAVYVTTAARAKEMMTVRTYYVGDLAGVMDVRFGPFLNQFKAQQNLAMLVNLIIQTIEPSSWEINGGNGAITFEPITMSLVVKQSAEVHYMMRNGLR